MARAEVDARADLKVAQDAYDEALTAAEKLGSCNPDSAVDNTTKGEKKDTCFEWVDANAPDDKKKIDDTSYAKVSTGMSAVLVAAAKARVAIVKQQEFHDAREQWARDNLAPIKAIFDLAKSAHDDAKG